MRLLSTFILFNFFCCLGFSAELSLNLSEAIDLALRHNPELAAQSFDLSAAQSRVESASGRRHASLDFISSGTYFTRDQRLLPASRNGEFGAFSDKIITADFVLTMPIYTGGRLTNELEAQSLLSAAVGKRLARSREELIFNVSSVFLQILAQNRVIESLEFSQEALREHIKKVSDMIKAEKAAAVDKLRVEVRVADLEQRMIQEQNILAVQTRILANLLGRDEDDSELKPVGKLNELQMPESSEEKKSIAELLEKRSDYQAASARLEAGRKMLQAAKAKNHPQFAMQGSFGRRLAVNSPDRKNGFDSTKENGWIGLTMKIPIYSGGQIQAGISEELAKLNAEQERLRKLQQLIFLEIETAQLNIQAAKRRLETLMKISEQAEESLRIEREKYELGKGSITDVLDAQSALLDSQTNYCRAMADFHTAQAQYKLAKGE
jgi:outer membrane protein